MVAVLVEGNIPGSPEAVPGGGHEAQVGAGARRGHAGLHLALRRLLLLLQVLEAPHLRHARERLRLALVVHRQPLPAEDDHGSRTVS